MAFLYPWGNTQQLNLNWILQKIKDLEAGSGGADLDEVASALISASYAVQAYDRSDIVFHDGKLYRANQAIPAPGEVWTPAHWDEILLGDTVSNLVQYVAALSNNQIVNSSSVTGTHTSDALDTLKNTIDNANDTIDDIQHQITGFIETGDTASQTYYKGAYLVWKGDLYRVIVSVINPGDAFVVDTNIKALTLESVLVTLTVPISVPNEAGLKRTSFNFSASAPIPLGSTGVTLEAYAIGTVISTDGTDGVLFASGYSGNLYVAFLSGGVFVRAQIYDNRSQTITLTANSDYVSATNSISCLKAGNVVCFSGTITLGAVAITGNTLLSGLPLPVNAIDIFGTIVEATDTTLRGKSGRFRINTDGTLAPWYNTWGASDSGNVIAFNATYYSY